MGRGGDGSALGRRTLSIEKLKSYGKDLKDDLTVLKSIWFSKAKGDNHADRLEAFYSPQAHAYDRFRSSFLWGRQPLLAACAARLSNRNDLVWVDLGGGTGENVDLMSEYIPIDHFKAIYVVDLCASLCKQAEIKVKSKKWTNVHVIEADACKFALTNSKATLITFSYSLSMIPPFHSAIDQALSYLCDYGLMGICDFYVSGKYDLPSRQMSWSRRFFWRSIFDTDNIDIGPERRSFADHRLEREWEINSEGSIPYVPYLKAPWYAWIGKKQPSDTAHHHEKRPQAPLLFPPTFLYTMSWEDPDLDVKVLKISEGDVILTLTSGGCNSLNLALHGAGDVYSVDCNPAQSALLELKKVSILQLEYEDFWKMFGEGKHDGIDKIYRHKLAPFLTQSSYDFWNKKLYHFKRGLYYAGGMGKLCWFVQYLFHWVGISEDIKKITQAPTLDRQIELWDNIWILKYLKNGRSWLVKLIIRICTLLFTNRFVLWFGGGVPCKQYTLIMKDGLSMGQYLARTFDGVARHSLVSKDNYFYLNCLTGSYTKDCCPAYLKEDSFLRLKEEKLINRLHVRNGTFNSELKARSYNKVILMDHVDWMDTDNALEVVSLLSKQVVPGGRIIWRSASYCPPYVKMMQVAGFDVTCIQRADRDDCYYMDKVNMYNSFYCAERKLHFD